MYKKNLNFIFPVIFMLFINNGFAGGPCGGYFDSGAPFSHSLTTNEQNLLNSISTLNNLDTLDAQMLLSVLNDNNIGLNADQANQLRQNFNQYMGVMAYAMSGFVDVATLRSMIPFLGQIQAEKLFDLLAAGNYDAAERLLAVLFFDKFGIQILSREELLLRQVKAVVQPSQPTSPTIILTTNTINGILGNFSNFFNFGAPTGDFSLDNVYVAGDYSYTEYDFTDTNDTGHIHYKSLTLGANVNEKISFSFSFFHDQVDQRGPNDLLSNQLGMSLAVTYNITENYGLSALGFYSEADIEEINDNTFTYGGGLLFSSYHRFGNFEFSTSNTIVRSVTDFGNDLLWLANMRLGYHWTDEFNTGIYGYYVDSMDEDVDIDSSYTIIGGDMTYQFTEQLAVTLGFESVQHLKNYKSETYFISFLYKF